MFLKTYNTEFDEIIFTYNKASQLYYDAYFLNVERSNSVFLKTYNTEFDEIIITFMDQNDRPLEIEDKVNFNIAY